MEVVGNFRLLRDQGHGYWLSEVVGSWLGTLPNPSVTPTDGGAETHFSNYFDLCGFWNFHGLSGPC